jgi:hypothetical protein
MPTNEQIAEMRALFAESTREELEHHALQLWLDAVRLREEIDRRAGTIR